MGALLFHIGYQPLISLKCSKVGKQSSVIVGKEPMQHSFTLRYEIALNVVIQPLFINSWMFECQPVSTRKEDPKPQPAVPRQSLLAR